MYFVFRMLWIITRREKKNLIWMNHSFLFIYRHIIHIYNIGITIISYMPIIYIWQTSFKHCHHLNLQHEYITAVHLFQNMKTYIFMHYNIIVKKKIIFLCIKERITYFLFISLWFGAYDNTLPMTHKHQINDHLANLTMLHKVNKNIKHTQLIRAS